MKKIETGRLITVKQIAAGLAYLKIKIGKNAQNFMPGNFVTILPPASSGKYLRRPFSVAGILEDSIELIIKNIGPVTESLVSLREGSEVQIMGPLGNSYQLPSNIKKLWLVGGGTGIASLLFLKSFRSSSKASADKILWAGKSKEFLPSSDLLIDRQFSHIFGKNIAIATDDGSEGEKGTASEVVSGWLDKETPDAIASCGPHGMMKEIKKIADSIGIPAWFSLEEFMACGTGACAGCAVPAQAGSYLKVCSDGPVFKSSEVIL